MMERERRTLPQNDLDMQMMTTNSVWGRSEISPELKERLNRYFEVMEEDGEKKFTKSSLWGLLGFYTRDMRLANLSYKQNELQYCQHYLDLANDLLQSDMIEPFLICLSRVATILELSQSKNGFLRKQFNTQTENINQRVDEPPKKKLFGMSKNNRGEF